jgi:DNA polymerase III delta prime subunit
MNKISNEYLWVEAYRPTKIEDCILPENQKTIFREMLGKKDMPNMLLCGGSGMGKTTVAKALVNEMGLDLMFINASLESGIDVLRTKIMNFASTVSFSGGVKVVILDEADYTNPQSFQPALRGFIEEFSNNCRFIFTCNYKNRIIPPLHSRCTVIEFKIEKEEKSSLMQQFYTRLKNILKNEGIIYDNKVLAAVIAKYFSDYRRILNELQRYSVSGNIDEGILANINELNMAELKESLVEKDWNRMRKWVVNNLDNDSSTIFRKIYDTILPEVIEVPHLVLLLADYQYKSSFVVDQEINMVACLTDIMSTVKFK